MNGIPMHFTHMIPCLNRFVFGTKFQRIVRIAFQIYGMVAFFPFFERSKSKHFSPNLEDKCVLVKRKGFFCSFFGQAIVVKIFYIHTKKKGCPREQPFKLLLQSKIFIHSLLNSLLVSTLDKFPTYNRNYPGYKNNY